MLNHISGKLKREWGNNAIARFPQERYYNTLVVSDAHMPRADGHPKYLHEFLTWNYSDKLILLGDTHEGYNPALSDFKELHYRVLDLVSARKAQGVVVVDTPGNHDSYKRASGILGHRVYGTEYWNDLVLPSAHGDTYLFHGDALDGPLAREYDRAAHRIASKIGIGKFSLLDLYSKMFKLVHDAQDNKSGKTNEDKIEFAAAQIAKGHGCRAVLTGHTHKPAPFMPVKSMPDMLYGNTGAWVGGLGTAMALNHNGTWELIDWRRDREKFFSAKPAGLDMPDMHRDFREASEAELQWHRVQHSLHSQKIIINMTKDTLESMKKIRANVQIFLHRAEEKFHITEAEAEKLRSHAPIERIEQPATSMAGAISPRPHVLL